MLFCRLLIFLKINFFKKKSFNIIPAVSNSLDHDQARHFVGPDRGPNCLPRSSAYDTSRQRFKGVFDQYQQYKLVSDCS